MTGTVIVDTGPLVTFFDRDEEYHQLSLVQPLLFQQNMHAKKERLPFVHINKVEE